MIAVAPHAIVTYADLAAGRFGDPRRSGWITINQASVTQFGLVTLDPDPNHIDSEYAAAHSPFGGAAAFGFQSLAMLTHLGNSAGIIPSDAVHIFNYGLDHVRFVAPVLTGARVRGVFTFDGVIQRALNRILVTYGVSIEIDGGERPALVAKWLALFEGRPQA